MTLIAALGDRDSRHLTHREIDAAITLVPEGAEIRWLPTDGASLEGFDGVWVLPGTPYRDDAAVLDAIRFAREQGMPILGSCGGFQYMAVEFARNVAGIADAAHEETEPDADDLVVARLGCSLIGEQRTVTTVPGTRLAAICGCDPFVGFHWCSFGLAAGSVERLTAAGLVVGARADDAGVEGFELPGHPFYLATLFQPQVGSSTSTTLHPLLTALIEAARGTACR
ncbi:MAG: gamma-glutamyl-gamma-aminobutyrate hydrolase family protein [Gaiellales bacterium]